MWLKTKPSLVRRFILNIGHEQDARQRGAFAVIARNQPFINTYKFAF
jgi:hypothetical protein